MLCNIFRTNWDLICSRIDLGCLIFRKGLGKFCDSMNANYSQTGICRHVEPDRKPRREFCLSPNDKYSSGGSTETGGPFLGFESLNRASKISFLILCEVSNNNHRKKLFGVKRSVH